MVATVSAQGTWVEEPGNLLAFYQRFIPAWIGHPYIEELSRVRDGMKAGDQLTVLQAMNEFQRLLRASSMPQQQRIFTTSCSRCGLFEGEVFTLEQESGSGKRRLMRAPEQRALSSPMTRVFAVMRRVVTIGGTNRTMDTHPHG